MDIFSTKVVSPKSPSKGTLFFLSGFPDIHNSFLDTLVPELGKEYHCIVACLPDYDRPKLSKFLGYNPREIVAILDRTIESMAPSTPITLILHDWGSVYGLSWYLKHPSKVDRLVCLDVFSFDVVQTAKENSNRELFWLLLYQWWLVLVFLSGRIVPIIGNILLLTLAISKLGPDLAPPPRSVLCPPKGARWFMCYPYFHFWLDRLRKRHTSDSAEFELCPVFYAYGTKKRVMFHSRKELAQMACDPRHKIIEYDCGHWVQHAKSLELSKEIRNFLRQN